MKVTIKNIETKVDFSALEIGDTFLWGNDCWLKVERAAFGAGCINAVIINTGRYGYFNDYDKVELVKTELVLYK